MSKRPPDLSICVPRIFTDLSGAGPAMSSVTVVTTGPYGSTVTIRTAGVVTVVAVVILASVAGAVFLAGAVLFVVGLMQPSGKRRTADSTSVFGFLVRHAWKVLFPPPGTNYPLGQRMMAGGLMLIAVSALLGIGALGAAVAQSDSTTSSMPSSFSITGLQA